MVQRRSEPIEYLIFLKGCDIPARVTAVLDTALHEAKKLSSTGFVYEVWVKDGLTESLRAFGVMGHIKWSVACNNCAGNGRAYNVYGLDIQCPDCSGYGRRPEQ